MSPERGDLRSGTNSAVGFFRLPGIFFPHFLCFIIYGTFILLSWKTELGPVSIDSIVFGF